MKKILGIVIVLLLVIMGGDFLTDIFLFGFNERPSTKFEAYEMAQCGSIGCTEIVYEDEGVRIIKFRTIINSFVGDCYVDGECYFETMRGTIYLNEGDNGLRGQDYKYGEWKELSKNTLIDVQAIELNSGFKIFGNNTTSHKLYVKEVK